MDNDIQLYLKFTDNPNGFKQEERKTIVDIIGNIRKKEEHKNKFIQYFGYDSPVLLRIFNKLDLPVCKRFLKITGQNFKNQKTTTNTQQVPPPPPPKPQPIVVPSNIQSMTSTERKNYLTSTDIEKLNNKTITKDELQKYIDQTLKGRVESPNKQIAIAEFQRKIAQLDEKEKEEREIENITRFDFDYNSEFQKKNASEISVSQRQIEHLGGASKSQSRSMELTFEFYNKFSLLNIGLYPKLISIMLNPEIFCKMWYGSLQLNKPIQNPYVIVNELLHTFFIKCYERVSKQETPQTFNNKERIQMIDRDTKLFKALRIQNLLILRDRLILEKKNNEQDEFNDFRGKVIFGSIMKQIDLIKEDRNRYIFNYKLLNELQQHNLRAGQSIIGFKQKSYLDQKDSNNYETVLEVYYYNEQIQKSLERLLKINEIFEKNLPFTSFAEVKNNIRYKNIIEETYTDLISKFAQVLTYVKERNDAPSYNLSGKVNPRYNIVLKYEKLVEENGLITKTIENVAREKPIAKGDPELKYYDFEIKYFNYPNVIGLKNPNEVYFDASTWKVDEKTGDFIGKPTKTNYTIERAEQFVSENENKKYWEHYKLGKINRYYGRDVKSEEIAADPECGLILLNKLRNFENIIIVGNGQSGAGKTAALISRTSKGENYPGLLPSISNQLIKPEEDFDENIQYFNKASVKLINLYLKLDDKLDDISKMTPDHYYPYNIKLFKTDENSNPILKDGKLEEENETEYNFIPINGKWRCTNKNSKENRLLDQIIAEAFEIREEEPTKNNPNSSRSHIVVCVTFSGDRKLSTGNVVTDNSRVVICDLAGVEDRFTCELSELMILDKNYSTKSNKYKTLNDVGKPFKPEERTKMRLKPIEYDNFFCSNKYYTDKLFPNKILQDKKELVDQVIEFKQKYETLKSGTDPIRNKIHANIENFKKNPITQKDVDDFKGQLQGKVGSQIKDDIFAESLKTFQQYTYNNGQIHFDPINDNNGKPIIFDQKLESGNVNTGTSKKSCSTMQECCDMSEKDKLKQINSFMSDFTKLPDGTDPRAHNNTSDPIYGNFEQLYKGKSNESVKNMLKEKIQKIINEGKDGLFNMETPISLEINDFKNGITEVNNVYTTLINSTNSKKDAANKKCEEEKSSNGTNFTRATTEIDNERRKLQSSIDAITRQVQTIETNVATTKAHNKLLNSTIKTLQGTTAGQAYISGIKSPDIKKEIHSVLRFEIDTKKPKSDSSIYYTKKISSQDIQSAIASLQNKITSTESEDLQIKQLQEKGVELADQIKNLRPETLKLKFDAESDIALAKELEKIENEFLTRKANIVQIMSKLNQDIQTAYFKDLITHRYKDGDKNIKDYLSKPEERGNDIEKIRYLIQQLVRFSQLEFNCILRRKEGFMINTSLKEMQKFIGSILFESSKRRFNKVLIENNLLKMDEKIYRYNDYIKYNNDITLSINTIKSNLHDIINEKNNNDEEKTSRITNKINEIVDLCKLVKKQVLRYFMYMVSIINGDENKYKNNIDLPGLLIYVCFVNTIISVLINDKINFDLILNAISNMGSIQFNEIFTKQIIKNINGNIVVDTNDLTFRKMAEMFSELYTEQKTKSDFKVLKAMYEYSKKITDSNSSILEISKVFDQIFPNKDGQHYQIKTSNANEIFNTKNKINVGSAQFENFYEDFTHLWDKLNLYTSKNIKLFNEEVKKATYDNGTLHPTPLLYSSPSIDSCVEAKNKFDDEYDKFYNYKKNNSALEFLFEIMTSSTDHIEKVSQTGQKITFPIKGFGLEIENSTLVIFTVINITPNPTAPTNNPPTPPFININKLKLIYKIISIPDTGTTTVESILRTHPTILQKIEHIGQKYLAKLGEYEFYRPFVSGVFKDVLETSDKIILEKGKNLKEKIIDFIDSNNATTLLGTVDFEKFTKIRDPSQPYYICDDKQESTLKQMVIVEQIEKLLEEKE